MTAQKKSNIKKNQTKTKHKKYFFFQKKMSAEENKGVKREREEEITLNEGEREKMRRVIYQLAADQPEEFAKVMKFSEKIDHTICRVRHSDFLVWEEGAIFGHLDEQKIRNILTRHFVKKADANETTAEPIITDFIATYLENTISKLCNSNEFYELLEDKLNAM